MSVGSNIYLAFQKELPEEPMKNLVTKETMKMWPNKPKGYKPYKGEITSQFAWDEVKYVNYFAFLILRLLPTGDYSCEWLKHKVALKYVLYGHEPVFQYPILFVKLEEFAPWPNRKGEALTDTEAARSCVKYFSSSVVCIHSQEVLLDENGRWEMNEG